MADTTKEALKIWMVLPADINKNLGRFTQLPIIYPLVKQIQTR